MNATLIGRRGAEMFCGAANGHSRTREPQAERLRPAPALSVAFAVLDFRIPGGEAPPYPMFPAWSPERSTVHGDRHPLGIRFDPPSRSS